MPPAVSVARPIAREVSDYADYTGRVDKPVETPVIAPVTGIIEKEYFKIGQTVKQGDLLAELLPDTDALPAAEAAMLKPLQERRKKAEETMSRKHVGPPLSPEAERQRKAKAEEEMKAAREALDAACAKLTRTKVFAPCGGKIKYDAGHGPSLGIAGQPFTIIISLDSIGADFDVDERTVIQLRRSMAGQKTGWEFSLPVSCALADDRTFPIRGKISSVDNSVDSKTGTQKWGLVLPNKDGVLVPGMFLRVRLTTQRPYKALLIPERSLGSDAVGSDQGQKFVLVVNGQSAVERRDVEIGQLQDDGLRVVTKGLGGDDRVVLDPSKVTAVGMAVKPEEPAAATPATKPPAR